MEFLTIGIFLLHLLSFGHTQKSYCQPDENCWPTEEEIDDFAQSLSPFPNLTNILPEFPTFMSIDKPGPTIYNLWFEDEPQFATTYHLATRRNFINNQLHPYFVIMARNVDDVAKAVHFASSHNIGIAIMSTGHEFQDRNAGPGANSLLIRTTCLRGAEFNLEESNQFGHSDGYVKLGAGMTWGTSKMANLRKGVHQLANEVGRIVVSGHAGEVGVVGWMLGGGHSPLSPLHGLGVDQVLEVELIGADGSHITANSKGTIVTSFDKTQTYETESTDLFWALRGGGGGNWGVITSLTVKVHKPRDDCVENCYFRQDLSFVGYYEDSDQLIGIINAYLSWCAKAGKYWSSYAFLYPLRNDIWIFYIAEALHVGADMNDSDLWTLQEAFSEFYDMTLTNETKIYDTYYDKLQDQAYESIGTQYQIDDWTSAFFNASTCQSEDFASFLVSQWFPACLQQEYCNLGYNFAHSLASTYDNDDIKNTAVSQQFRTGVNHIIAPAVFSIVNNNMTWEEKSKYMHEDFGPKLYAYSTGGSYFSESEATLEDGQFQSRFWGENALKLLEVKLQWDPTFVFTCRNCVGYGEEPKQINEETLPPWRKLN